MNEYAAIAQVVYRNGKWRGSFGLPSITFRAANKPAALRHARRFYMREWIKEKADVKRRTRSPRVGRMQLVKLHINVEAL